MSGHAEAGITRVSRGGGVFGGPMTQKRNPVRNGRCLTAYKATGGAVACGLALAPIRLNRAKGCQQPKGPPKPALTCATFFSQTEREETTDRNLTQIRLWRGNAAQ